MKFSCTSSFGTYFSAYSTRRIYVKAYYKPVPIDFSHHYWCQKIGKYEVFSEIDAYKECTAKLEIKLHLLLK